MKKIVIAFTPSEIKDLIEALRSRIYYGEISDETKRRYATLAVVLKQAK